MGFFERNIKNWTSVIKNEYDGNLLICKHEEENFNTNSTLIVAPSEEAIFINNGVIQQVFENGTYNLNTQNYPFIGELRNLFSGGKDSFTSSVYFVRKAHSLEVKWGTDSPVALRDPVLGITTSVRARGAYKIQIDNASKFLVKLLGNNINYLEQEELNKYFINEFQQHIKSALASSIVSLNKEIIGINAEQNAIAQKVAPELQTILNEYGIKLVTFSIASIDVVQDDPNRQKLEEAFANKKAMEILGSDWSKQQSSEILHNISKNEGGLVGSMAGIGAGLSLGGVMGEMTKDMVQNQPTGKNCPKCNAQNQACAKFCFECGYKFETAKFCTNCGLKLDENTKFCPNCGQKTE